MASWYLLTPALLALIGVVSADLISDVGGDVIDMTHTLDKDIPYWGMAGSFKLNIIQRGMVNAGYWYESNDFMTSEHGGTHIDAPSHFGKGKQRVDQIPLDRLIGQAIHMNFTQEATNDPDFQVNVPELEAWEEKHGKFPKRSIILLDHGWTHKWPDANLIFGTSMPNDTSTYHFPGLHSDAAQWLIDKRPQVTAVGIDTPSIDYGQSTTFLTHRMLFSKNVPAFENVANMHLVPTSNATVFAMPIKIGGGSGGPLRIFVVIPRKSLTSGVNSRCTSVMARFVVPIIVFCTIKSFTP